MNFLALLRAFSFGSTNIVSRAFNQFVQFLGPLPIELDSISVRVNFAFKTLKFTAAARNLRIDFFQGAALLSQIVFACVDFGVSGIF
ncbi:MAG: hypothetical protein Udaeo2_31040 [Candidatus Udaeobacter sp.]|nr:MAG: hypothetical protein Udaeo2_31040 [Candidatus Udaeobacter sp.]